MKNFTSLTIIALLGLLCFSNTEVSAQSYNYGYNHSYSNYSYPSYSYPYSYSYYPSYYKLYYPTYPSTYCPTTPTSPSPTPSLSGLGLTPEDILKVKELLLREKLKELLSKGELPSAALTEKAKSQAPLTSEEWAKLRELLKK